MPSFFSLLSAVGGVMATLTAVFDIIATIKKEQGTVRICCNKRASLRRWGDVPIEDGDDDDENEKRNACCKAVMEYFSEMRRGNMIGATIVIFIYIIINVVLFIQRFGEVNPRVLCSQEQPPCSTTEYV